MLKVPQILVSALLLAALTACGQKGDLFLPTEPAAQNRATLPQTLSPGGGRDTGTAAPVRTP